MQEDFININNKYVVMLVNKTEGSNNSATINKPKDVLAQGVFKVDYIPSVNTLYMYSEGRKVMDPQAKLERFNIWNQLQRSGHSPSEIPDNVLLNLEIGYYVKQSINKRDLDNFSKHIIDSIATFYKFNDSRVYNLSCYKRLITNSNTELVYYRIKKIDIENIKVDYRLLT